MDPSSTNRFQANRLLRAQVADITKTLLSCKDSIDNNISESQRTSSLAERVFWMRTKRILNKAIEDILEDIPQ